MTTSNIAVHTTAPLPAASMGEQSMCAAKSDAGFQEAIGAYLFSLAAIDNPDTSGRWQRITEHLAAWLFDEWQHEQRRTSNDVAC